MINLSNKENNLILYAKYNFGEYYDIAIESLQLTKCLVSIEPKCHIFFHFFNHASNCFYLSVLSFLRRHSVQANMILRQAIESSALAAYSIVNTNLEDFGEIKLIGEKKCLYPKENIKNKAYDWLKSNYQIYSDVLKICKDNINKFISHANISVTESNIRADISNGKLSGLQFDSEIIENFQGMLVICTFIITNVLGLINTINKDYKSLTFINDFENKLDDIKNKSEILRKKILEYPVLKEYLNGFE